MHGAVQTVLFKTAAYTLAQQAAWLRRNGFRATTHRATRTETRWRQFPPSTRYTYRTLTLKPGIKLILAFRKKS